jgi:hypothetical protein
MGFSFVFTLESEPAAASGLDAIPRAYPTRALGLADLVRSLDFAPARPASRRIASLSLDALAAVGEGPAQDEALGRLVEQVRALGVGMVVLDAAAALPMRDAPLGPVYFPTALRPLRRDLLGRVTWQMRTRAGVQVYLRLPVGPAVAALGEADALKLFADMIRHARADGLVLDAPPPAVAARVADRPEAVRARRAALDPDGLDPRTRLAAAAYRAAAAIDPQLRVMLTLDLPTAPPDWADIGLLPVVKGARDAEALTDRLRADGWMQPETAGRVVLSLPADPKQRVAALRRAQRKGAVGFAVLSALPLESGDLPAAFSAATYPYKP